MNIALIGYGKMGKLIEQVARDRSHHIGLIVDINNRNYVTKEELKKNNVAIEFTTPQAATENIKWCIDCGVPVVVGTTGWYHNMEQIKEYCQLHNGTVLWGSNFSVGVNILFALNRFLARIMNQYEVYEPVIEEIHHVHKLDAPSGTAITLAEGILQKLNRKKRWVNNMSAEPETLSVQSFRIGETPGTHVVRYTSNIDDIEIKHTAHNRLGFALGAVLAAEWLKNKTGFFSVNDMYNFQ